MPELYHALYFSKALVPDTKEVHDGILATSQRNNIRANISGFLHRESGFFIQFLEGPKTKLFNTLSRIGRDPRHSEFNVIRSQPARMRMLPDWSMGFTDPSQLSLAEILEVSDGQLNIKALDPFDLVVLLVHNSQALRSNA